jgi:hypothetical protein
MHDADIRGSIAYAKSLALVGILTSDEEAKITEGLIAVEKEWKTGTVRLIFRPVLIVHLPTMRMYSSRSKQMMRTFTRRTKGDLVNLSALSAGNCTQVALGTTKLQQICVCGSSKKLVTFEKV